MRESDLNRHLRSNKDDEAGMTSVPKSSNASENKSKNKKTKSKKKGAPVEFGSNDDVLLGKAIEHLKSVNTGTKRKPTNTAKKSS